MSKDQMMNLNARETRKALCYTDSPVQTTAMNAALQCSKPGPPSREWLSALLFNLLQPLPCCAALIHTLNLLFTSEEGLPAPQRRAELLGCAVEDRRTREVSCLLFTYSFILRLCLGCAVTTSHF